MRRSTSRLSLLAALVLIVACSGAPAQAPAGGSSAPPSNPPAAQPAKPAAAPGQPAAPPSGQPAPAAVQPSPAASGGQPATSGPAAAPASLDPELQKVYQEAVKVIPNLSPDVLAGAKREGALTLYRLTFEIETLYPEFNKLFPFVKITDYKASGGPLLQRYGSEVRASRYVADVVQSAEPSQVDELDNEGLVTKYELSSAGAFPEQYVRKGVYYPFAITPLCLAYNSDLVNDSQAAVLSQWDGMLDPRWKGQAGTIQFGVGGAGVLPYYFVAKEKGDEFWDKLFAQQPLSFAGNAVAAERLGAGGFQVQFFAVEGSFFDVQKKGAPLRWRCPEPALPISSVQFIGKDAPHPNAAKLWIEWLLSKQGQSLTMKNIGQPSARTDMTDERAITKESWYQSPKSYYRFNWTDVLKERQALQARWDRSAATLRKAQ